MDSFHVRVETNFMLENQVIYDKMNSYETIFFFFLPMMTDVTQGEKKPWCIASYTTKNLSTGCPLTPHRITHPPSRQAHSPTCNFPAQACQPC